MPLAQPSTSVTCCAWLNLGEALAPGRSRSPGSCVGRVHNAVRARGVACARGARGLGQGPDAASAAWEVHPDVLSRAVPQLRRLYAFETAREAEEHLLTVRAPRTGRCRSAGWWRWQRQRQQLQRGAGAARGPGPQEARDARRSAHLPEAHSSIVTDDERLDDLRSMVQLGWKLTISTRAAAVWSCVRGRGRGRALGCERAPSYAAPSVRRDCYAPERIGHVERIRKNLI